MERDARVATRCGGEVHVIRTAGVKLTDLSLSLDLTLLVPRPLLPTLRNARIFYFS